MAIDSGRLQRIVPLDGMHNLRDLGGYTGRAGQLLRWHQLYRADDLATATRRDLTMIGELGVRTIIDLRTNREAALRPCPSLPGAFVDRHHLPLLRDSWRPRVVGGDDHHDPVEVMAGRYLEMLVEGAPAIADALAIMAVPSAYPIVFHSKLGKDRAGMLTAVVLGLLAVHDEMIVEDYALSEPLLAGERVARADDPAQRADLDAGAPPEVMVRVLERVRERARSMVGFARGIGVPFETVEALHGNLLV